MAITVPNMLGNSRLFALRRCCGLGLPGGLFRLKKQNQPIWNRWIWWAPTTLWLFNIAMGFRWPIYIDGLPMKNGWIFPWRTVSHNQRVLMTKSDLPLILAGKITTLHPRQVEEVHTNWPAGHWHVKSTSLWKMVVPLGMVILTVFPFFLAGCPFKRMVPVERLFYVHENCIPLKLILTGVFNIRYAG